MCINTGRHQAADPQLETAAGEHAIRMKWTFELLLVIGLVGLSRSMPGDYDADQSPDSEEFGQFAGPKSTNCSCGATYKQGGRIVGGRETLPNQYPYMARLGYLTPRGTKVSGFCGCSLITQHHALTAAHCTYKEHGQPLGIVVGDHDATDSKNKIKKVYPVSKVIEHENWDDNTYQNDIAILVINEKIQLTPQIGLICLPHKPEAIVNQYVKVTGWGLTKGRGEESDVLLKVNLKVMDYEECRTTYTKKAITKTQLCTYTKGKDSCQGDSGGPVVWLDPSTNRYTQVGVVSFGTGCATRMPGINTHVYSHIGWIQKTINANSPSPVNTCSRRD